MLELYVAMGISSETLGFHPVYLAMSIGSGSLVGDWMNNSGFWIFARMGVLSETETLKTWTILTATLGLAGFGFTVFFATLLPMAQVTRSLLMWGPSRTADVRPL